MKLNNDSAMLALVWRSHWCGACTGVALQLGVVLHFDWMQRLN